MFKTLIILLSVIFVSPVAAQINTTLLQPEANRRKSEAILVSRYEKHITGSYRLEEDSITLVDKGARERNARVAIRFCSQKSLPEVLGQAAANPSIVTDYLVKFYQFSSEKFLYLRSSDCIGNAKVKTKYAPVELWVVPEGADLPPAIDTAILTLNKNGRAEIKQVCTIFDR